MLISSVRTQLLYIVSVYSISSFTRFHDNLTLPNCLFLIGSCFKLVSLFYIICLSFHCKYKYIDLIHAAFMHLMKRCLTKAYAAMPSLLVSKVPLGSCFNLFTSNVLLCTSCGAVFENGFGELERVQNFGCPFIGWDQIPSIRHCPKLPIDYVFFFTSTSKFRLYIIRSETTWLLFHVVHVVLPEWWPPYQVSSMSILWLKRIRLPWEQVPSLLLSPISGILYHWKSTCPFP